MTRTTDAPPRDWKEGRRLRALELYEAGWKAIRIAEALGVTRGAVSQWLKAAREGGRDALRRRPGGATAPTLTVEQRAQLPTVLAKGAEAYGFIGDVWTTARVAAVIGREFGVRHHPAHVSRILGAIRWTVQKPVKRSTQRNEAAITAWREERQPSLQGKPRRRAARSSREMSPGFIRCRSWRERMRRVDRHRCCVRRSRAIIAR
ncbi:MAG: winged helix-turn-helix domain-containing protein [Pseudonocardiaceae bacterium]